MLIEKEVIGPGTYWYIDEKTNLPRKWTVTPETTKQLHKDGNEMISLGLPVPIPFEHDFAAHPLTPKEKLLGNAGEVKEYRLKGDTLFSVCDIQDEEARKKVGKSIRWTSPWISSFVDGNGRQWNNVIAHLALTTRPRVTKQTPFQSIAAALSLATEARHAGASGVASAEGFTVSRAGRLVTRKKDKRLRPQYPMAFSLYSGIRLAEEDDLTALKDDGEPAEKPPEEGEEATPDIGGLMNPLQDQTGDVKMEELLCDLLNALGVQMPENVGEAEFKRALYEATMTKIKELTSKGQAAGDANAQAADTNTTSPAGNGQPNPLIQQEQQPMYMSLEEINKLPDPMKGVALAMYAENQKLRGEMEANQKITNSLRDAKLKEAATARTARVTMLSRLSPRVKADLDAMLALPSMALSMGEGGAVVDPMAQTLAVLEKGLGDMPRLLTTDQSALSVQPQPTDNDLSQEATDAIADNFARMMGAAPEKKAS